jgi:hypothetical protein
LFGCIFLSLLHFLLVAFFCASFVPLLCLSHFLFSCILLCLLHLLFGCILLCPLHFLFSCILLCVSHLLFSCILLCLLHCLFCCILLCLSHLMLVAFFCDNVTRLAFDLHILFLTLLHIFFLFLPIFLPWCILHVPLHRPTSPRPPSSPCPLDVHPYHVRTQLYSLSHNSVCVCESACACMRRYMALCFCKFLEIHKSFDSNKRLFCD